MDVSFKTLNRNRRVAVLASRFDVNSDELTVGLGPLRGKSMLFLFRASNGYKFRRIWLKNQKKLTFNGIFQKSACAAVTVDGGCRRVTCLKKWNIRSTFVEYINDVR